VQMDDDVKKYAAEHPDDIELIVKVAEDKVEVQQNQMREFIDLGVDCIIISPKESQPLTQPVAEAIDAGIPVIVLDRKVEGDKYTCFIGADNTMIGEAAGQYVVKILGGKGNVVELKGLMTSTPGQERHDGFVKGLGAHLGKGKIEIVFDADCHWKETDAQNEMKSALSRFDKIDVVYGHNDPSAHGAYTAAQQEGKGREKTIKFIGIDALPQEGIRYVKDGILAASFQYQNGAKEAIDMVLKLKAGEKIPKNFTLPTRVYTGENVDQGGEVITEESLRAGG
jgi:ribose transport system substrate-binding protein